MAKDYTGLKINELTVIKKTKEMYFGSYLWVCKCSCGKITKLTASVLGKESNKTCGDYKRHRKNYKGKKFTYWTVIEDTYDTKGYILCRCKCGTERRVRIYALLKGVEAFSCGCYNREILKKVNSKPYGEAGFNRLYRNYRRNAKQRGFCFRISKDFFKKKTKEKCFYCGEKPLHVSKGTTPGVTPYFYNGIDRVDPYKGYVPGNVVSSCRHCNSIKSQVDYNIVKKCLNFLMKKIKPIINKKSSIHPMLVIRIFRTYINSSKKRNYSFELTEEKFSLLLSSNCYYCKVSPAKKMTYDGEDYYYNGIDRVDNSKGYSDDNCVPCCKKCNTKKMATTVDMMKKIVKFYEK